MHERRAAEKGKRVAADTSVAALLRRREAQFTAQPLEVEDKLVTAAGAATRNISAIRS